MRAEITIIDDNGNPVGTYETMPSRTYDDGIATTHVFEFEYHTLNYNLLRQAGIRKEKHGKEL